MKTALALLLLTGCPAEQFGVELPKGGVEAMSNEDLQRDVWGLSRGQLQDRRPGQPGHADGLEFIGKRLQAMHTLPAFGEEMLQKAGEGSNLCTVQKGQGQEHIVIQTVDQGLGAFESASGVAALISLAKSFDVRERPAQSIVFCVIAGNAGLRSLQAQPVVPPKTVRATFNLRPMGRRLPTNEKSPGPKQDLDFRILLEEVRRVRTEIDAALQP
jgi:hypothetical protein